MNSTDNSEQKTKDNKSYSISEVIDTGSKVSALFLGIIYLCGFLTLNSYFYNYGIFDLGIASSDYLVAGSIFTLYIVTYALFGGRSIIFMTSWMVKHTAQLQEKHPSSFIPLIPFVYSFVELTFLHCLSAAIFSSYAFGLVEATNFYIVLSGAFFISYFLDTTNLDIKYPLSTTFVELTLKSCAVYLFFSMSSSSNMLVVFYLFAVFSLYINLVLDKFERYKMSREGITFTIVYSLIFFLGSAVSFGAMVYGNISKKIGGGESIEMEIGLQSTNLGSLGGELGDTVVGNVIYSSNENIYINKEDQTIVLPRTTVQWIRFSKREEK